MAHHSVQGAEIAFELERKAALGKEGVKRAAEDDPADEPPPKKVKAVSVKIDLETIIDACVKIVTINGRPFTALDDSGFREIIDPLLAALDPKVTLNSKNIQAEIVKRASRVKDKIKNELRGKLVSLKVDAATYHGRSILGVNCQVILNGELTIRNLAMKEMNTAHTAKNLKAEILGVASGFGLTVDNIYSLTTDSARNMLAVSKLLGLDPCEIPSSDIFDFEPVEKDSRVEDEEQDDLDTHIDRILDQLFEGMELEAGDNSVECVPCAAHCLQLAVKAAMEVAKFKDVLAETRKLVKKLRTPTVVQLLKELKLKKPGLDVEPRWSSTHDMVGSVLALESFCKGMTASNASFRLSDMQWESLRSIQKSLEPAKICTKTLQREQLFAGDFCNKL